MKNYAYVVLNGGNGTVSRAHWTRNRQPIDHPTILAHILPILATSRSGKSSSRTAACG